MTTQPSSLYSAAWRRARGLAGAILLLSLACDKDSTGPTPVPLATKSVVTVSRDTLVSGTLADIVLESRDKRGARVWSRQAHGGLRREWRRRRSTPGPPSPTWAIAPTPPPSPASMPGRHHHHPRRSTASPSRPLPTITVVPRARSPSGPP
ncbi:MAG: hypothetical protein IPI38_19795 [Gemmatimonadetes bacterium]|nr:hypothetical protein [Gemmatimonadota bacterium]